MKRLIQICVHKILVQILDLLRTWQNFNLNKFQLYKITYFYNFNKGISPLKKKKKKKKKKVERSRLKLQIMDFALKIPC